MILADDFTFDAIFVAYIIGILVVWSLFRYVRRVEEQRKASRPVKRRPTNARFYDQDNEPDDAA